MVNYSIRSRTSGPPNFDMEKPAAQYQPTLCLTASPVHLRFIGYDPRAKHPRHRAGGAPAGFLVVLMTVAVLVGGLVDDRGLSGAESPCVVAYLSTVPG
jgi:hypothetical protein